MPGARGDMRSPDVMNIVPQRAIARLDDVTDPTLDIDSFLAGHLRTVERQANQRSRRQTAKDEAATPRKDGAAVEKRPDGEIHVRTGALNSCLVWWSGIGDLSWWSPSLTTGQP